MQTLDAQHFRKTLGHFPTGVAVVTAMSEGVPTGMAVGSFTSVSLDPPLVAFLPAKSSTTFPKIERAGSFCVNVLAADQEAFCRTFATKGADRFTDVGWSPAPATGAPILEGAVAWVECDIERIDDAGDHFIVVGRVRGLDLASAKLPLIFFQGGYGRFSMRSLVAPTEDGLFDQLRVAALARDEMEKLAAGLRLECIAVGALGAELVIVASAGPPSRAAVPTRVGLRVPFVPPFGGLFVAWAEPAMRDSWLARLDNYGADRVDIFDGMLTQLRARGWSLALKDPNYVELENAIGKFSRGVTPIVARDVGRRIADLHGIYEPEELVDDETYDVWSLAAPIFDSDGEVILLLNVLALDGADGTMRGDEIVKCAERLSASAASVVERIGGRHPDA